jgi:hypothetical protein
LRHRLQPPHRRSFSIASNRRPKLMPPTARRFNRGQGMLPSHMLSPNYSMQRLRYSYMQINKLPESREYHSINRFSRNRGKLDRSRIDHQYRAVKRDNKVQDLLPSSRTLKSDANKKYNPYYNRYRDVEADHSSNRDQDMESHTELNSTVAPEVRVISQKLHASENISVVTLDSEKISTLSSHNTTSLRSEQDCSVKTKESNIMLPLPETHSKPKINSSNENTDTQSKWPIITFGNGRPNSSVIDYHLLVVKKKDKDTSSLVTDVMKSNHVYTEHPLERPEVLYNALQENLEEIAKEFTKVIPQNPMLDPRVTVEFINFNENAQEGPYLMLVGILNIDEPILKAKVGSFVAVSKGRLKGAKGIIKEIKGDQLFVVLTQKGMTMKGWIPRSNIQVIDEIKILQHFENKHLKVKEILADENETRESYGSTVNVTPYCQGIQETKGLDVPPKSSRKEVSDHSKAENHGAEADNDEISCDTRLLLYELIHDDKELKPLACRDFDRNMASFMSKENSFHESQRVMTSNHSAVIQEPVTETRMVNQTRNITNRHDEYQSKRSRLESKTWPKQSNNAMVDSTNSDAKNSCEAESNDVSNETNSGNEHLLYEMLPPLSHARDEMDVLAVEYQDNYVETLPCLEPGGNPSTFHSNHYRQEEEEEEKVENNGEYETGMPENSFIQKSTSSLRREPGELTFLSSMHVTSRKTKYSFGMHRPVDNLSCPAHRKLRLAPAIALGKRDILKSLPEVPNKPSNTFLLADIHYDYPVEVNGLVHVNQPELMQQQRQHALSPTITAANTTHQEPWSFSSSKSNALTYSQRRFNKFTTKKLVQKRKLPLSSNRVLSKDRSNEAMKSEYISSGDYSV